MARSSKPIKIKPSTAAILSIIVGILVIIVPAALAWAVGLYLIVTGALNLLPNR